MPQNDPASANQMNFLWNLVQGGRNMGMAMPDIFKDEPSTTAAFQAGFTKGNCSYWLDQGIMAGWVPDSSRLDPQGNPKWASEKQIGLFRARAQEVAQETGDQTWLSIEPTGRYSWTISKMLDKMQRQRDDAEKRRQQQGQQQQGGGWGGQQQQQPQQQQWGAPPAGQPQQQWGPPPAGQQQAPPPAAPPAGYQQQQQAPPPAGQQQQWGASPAGYQQQQAPPPETPPPYFDQYGNPIDQGTAGQQPFN